MIVSKLPLDTRAETRSLKVANWTRKGAGNVDVDSELYCGKFTWHCQVA